MTTKSSMLVTSVILGIRMKHLASRMVPLITNDIMYVSMNLSLHAL